MEHPVYKIYLKFGQILPIIFKILDIFRKYYKNLQNYFNYILKISVKLNFLSITINFPQICRIFFCDFLKFFTKWGSLPNQKNVAQWHSKLYLQLKLSIVVFRQTQRLTDWKVWASGSNQEPSVILSHSKKESMYTTEGPKQFEKSLSPEVNFDHFPLEVTLGSSRFQIRPLHQF